MVVPHPGSKGEQARRAGQRADELGESKKKKLRLHACAVAEIRAAAGLLPRGVVKGRYGKPSRAALKVAFGYDGHVNSIGTRAATIRSNPELEMELLEMAENQVEKDIYSQWRAQPLPESEEADETPEWVKSLDAIASKAERALEGRTRARAAVMKKETTVRRAAEWLTAAGVDVAHATVFRDVQRLREGKPVIVAKPKKQKAPKAVRLPTKKKPQKPQKEKSGVAGGVAPDDALAIAQLITSLSITSKIGDDGKAKARERLHKLSNRELAGILTMMHLDRPATTEGLREAVVSALPMIFAGGE